jgi:hypothetical protein
MQLTLICSNCYCSCDVLFLDANIQTICVIVKDKDCMKKPLLQL